MTGQTGVLVMVVEYVDEEGIVFDRSVTDRHGWASAEEAVRHWRSLDSRFEPYLNGRVVGGPGFSVRVFFEASS